MPVHLSLAAHASQTSRDALDGLVAARPERPGVELGPQTVADRRAAARGRVLLIEDNADNRETMKEILSLWGYEVETAGDGLTGMGRALAGGFHAAIVDIGLPGANGYEVARGVRGVLGSRIFLIALTGYCQAKDRQRALDAGFDAYMNKPADLDRLYFLLSNHTLAPALPAVG